MSDSHSGTIATSSHTLGDAYANKVASLVESLGKALVAFTLDANVSTVGRWAHGKNLPKNLEVQRKIENFYRIFQFLIDDASGGPERSPHEVRSWLMGMNPQLDDVSPSEAIRDGRYRAAMAAARAYAAGG